MLSSKEIKENTLRLQKLLEYIDRQLALIDAEGSLRICQKKGRTDYYHKIRNGSGRGKYIPKSEIELIKALAQKDYYEKAKKIIKRKYRALCMLDGTDLMEALVRLLEKMHPKRQELIKPIYLPNDVYEEKWRESKLPPKGFKDDDTSSFYTADKIRVRSKSEILIGDRLFMKNIVYEYEPGLILGGMLIHPDFKVLNSRTRQTFYFENFGMMDNPEYSARAVDRINLYILNGYFPGDGLLFTMETSKKPLDARVVDMLIDKYLT